MNTGIIGAYVKRSAHGCMPVSMNVPPMVGTSRSRNASHAARRPELPRRIRTAVSDDCHARAKEYPAKTGQAG